LNFISAEEVKAANKERHRAIKEANNYKEAARKATDDAERDVQVFSLSNYNFS